jgi:AcrR family transcriptional regulator
MNRITKPPAERKREILLAASELFQSIGYEETSVNMIIEKVNIAKGTFYYYFRSKEDLIEAIVDNMLDELIVKAEHIAQNDNLKAIQKIEKIISRKNPSNRKAQKIAKSFDAPSNRALNEKVNVQIVIRFSPVLSQIVEQGKKEGVFEVKDPLETVQFLITASQFLFDDGLFHWSQKEWLARRKVMQNAFEKMLGAKRNSFKFFLKN